MEKEQIYIAGDSLIIKSVTKNDLEDYLYIKRYATFMKEAYDEKKGLWEYMKPRLIENLEGNDCFCLIYYKGINRVIGYIDLELKNKCRPKVGIGILEDERKKGYAFEAARLLLKKVLEYEEIECIDWMTTSDNVASNRIAQKLGGKIIREEPILSEGAIKYWGNDSSGEDESVRYVTYGIYKIYKI